LHALELDRGGLKAGLQLVQAPALCERERAENQPG
jgi:hypothetical protein